MFAVGVDILHSTFKFAETANWKQATTEYKQQLWRGASHMSEQRRGLGDACVQAVPAEYASASSGSGDHPQQYYVHHPKQTTLVDKDFFPIFLSKTIHFIVTHLSENKGLLPNPCPPPRPGWTTSAWPNHDTLSRVLTLPNLRPSLIPYPQSLPI